MEGKTETYNGETWQTALKPSRLASPVMFIACTPIRCHEKGTLLLAPKIPSHSLLKRKHQTGAGRGTSQHLGGDGPTKAPERQGRADQHHRPQEMKEL